MKTHPINIIGALIFATAAAHSYSAAPAFVAKIAPASSPASIKGLNLNEGIDKNCI